MITKAQRFCKHFPGNKCIYYYNSDKDLMVDYEEVRGEILTSRIEPANTIEELIATKFPCCSFKILEESEE